MFRFALAACLAVLVGCASTPAEPRGTTFIIVRHAEKATDDPRDPALTQAGHARAQRLAQWLSGHDVVAVYATAYRRTRQTAAPTATAHGVPVTAYDAARPAAEFAASLKEAHTRGTVLVAGHSNTVPSIASALCDCDVPAMDESTYDRSYAITIVDGRATLAESRLP